MMSALTAALGAALLIYGGGWYLGYWIGNFSLLLFVLAIVTGAYWLAERLRFAPARQAAAQALAAQDAQRRAGLAKMGIDKVDGTLLVGDLILVNKFHYGVRLPVLNIKIIPNNEPKAGDVMVFRYPVDPRIDYIKRVVGVPGDEVAYINQKLTINGKPVPKATLPEFFDDDVMRYFKQYEETFDTRRFRLLNDDDRPAFVAGAEDFPFKRNCRYSVEGVVCKVPEGHYFMMGDNRDNSLDSRYWGFVPDQNIVGRAFMVWMNFSDLKRIGSFD